MSAIGGIINFGGGPVNDEVLTQLAQGLEPFGPDGGSNVRLDCAGMVYRAFHTNLESRSERQPLVLHGCALAWDGRLDNREELIRLLCDELRADPNDSAVVMAAYRKWGSGFLERIIGDFALSLWDSSSRTLFLARDLVGARLLFYQIDGETILWSSRLEALLGLPGATFAVNDEYVALYFTSHPAPELTPYKNIHAVPPGNVLSVHAGKTKLQRFWSLDPAIEIRYQTDHEYEEHFVHLFSEAVRARLRVDGPVWADLSGGLDSSSIVCVADRILEKETVQADRLETVSAVFDHSPSSDERKFISIVEEKRGQAGHHFLESEYPLLVELPVENFRVIPNPLETWSEYHKGMRQAMQARGVRVRLCGIGGDELLTASSDPSPELCDLLVEGKLGELHQRLQVWSLALKKPYFEILWNHTVVPSLPRRLRSFYKRNQRVKQLALLEPSFVKRFNLHDRLLGHTDTFGFRLPSARGQSIAFSYVCGVISAGYLSGGGPIEITYPFTHRPLIEFLQAIPATQWIRPGETRSLMRRALRDYLPPEIARRKGKGIPAEATLRAIRREWPRLRLLLKEALVCAGGYVNARSLKNLIEHANFERDPATLSILRICHLELWLRDVERRAQMVRGTAALDVSGSTAGNGRRARVAHLARVGPGATQTS
ncbi:MAG TPA: asparagine synthase-related protein [Pyrinomonadaceae bacterium]